MKIPFLLLADGAPPWIGTIVWATVVVIFLILFRPAIMKVIESLAEVSLKANSAGVEASFRRQKAEAAASLAAAAAARTPEDAPDTKAIAATVEHSFPRAKAKQFQRSSILWVDDRPNNNVNERRAFEAVGLKFTLAKSTGEALAVLQQQSFAAIISDMDRPPDPQAGYTLLAALRRARDPTPFFLYTGSNTIEHKMLAQKNGARGSTNNPQELFTIVTRAVLEEARE